MPGRRIREDVPSLEKYASSRTLCFLHNVLCDELCWTMNTGTSESPAKKADALLQLLRGPSLPCQSQRHTDAMLP